MSTVEEKLEIFTEKFNTELQQVRERQSQVLERLKDIQICVDNSQRAGEGKEKPKEKVDNVTEGQNGDHVDDSVPVSGGNNVDVNQASAFGSAHVAPSPGTQRGDLVDIQEEFRIISDSVSKIRLRPEQRLNDKGNVKQSLRSTAQILKRCARYTETTLKLLGKADPEGDNIQILSDLYVCASAEINYLQDEFANLLAENRYGADAAGVFRDLQSNTSVFTQDRVEKLKSAVELQAAHARVGQHDTGRFSSFNNNRRGGTPPFRKYQNRDNRYQFNNNYTGGSRQQDIFQNFNRSVPSVRPREITRTED